MNIAEVSKYLSVAISTVYKYIQKNRIPFYRKDKKVFFKRSDVDFYVLDSENRFFSMSELESEADTWIALRRMSVDKKKSRK
jgi:excisionase family DNA binding protein